MQGQIYHSNHLPISLFKSGQLFAVDPSCRGGLLIQKQFHVEFVGPGCAVGGHFDASSQSVYVIGTVRFLTPQTYTERQAAYHQRIACTEAIQKILLLQAPLRRAFVLIHFLCQRLGQARTYSIPVERLAGLVSVTSRTLELGRQAFQKKTAHQKQNQAKQSFTPEKSLQCA